VVGCSTLTTARYIKKLTDPFGDGPLQEVKDALGITMLTWKTQHRPEKPVQLNLEEFKDDPESIKIIIQKGGDD
jgi:hypothetical protein